jgi:multidrug resistance efflux pump
VTGLAVYGGYQAYVARRPYEWSGTVEARTISVGSRVGGRVQKVLVREGDRVAAGDPIVTLEPGDLEAQRLVAEGQLAEAEANQLKLQRGSRPEEIAEAKARADTSNAAFLEMKTGARAEEIAGAQARLAAADAAVDQAKLDADRAHRLFATNAVSQSVVDSADTQLRSATAQRDSAREALDQLKNGSRKEDIAQAASRAAEARASEELVKAGARDEDIKAALGVVEAARGRLDQIKVMLSELTIRAPEPSRVESLDLRPGDILAPSSTAATLIEDDQLYVRVYVPETQLGHLHAGGDVPVSVDSFPGRTLHGVVEHINGVGEYTPRNLQTADERANQVFATRIGLREGRDELRAGMAAFVHVPK